MLSFRFVEKNNLKKTSFHDLFIVVFSARYFFVLSKRQHKNDEIVHPRTVCVTSTRWTRCSYISRK